jgi:hypothetical protein
MPVAVPKGNRAGFLLEASEPSTFQLLSSHFLYELGGAVRPSARPLAQRAVE